MRRKRMMKTRATMVVAAAATAAAVLASAACTSSGSPRHGSAARAKPSASAYPSAMCPTDASTPATTSQPDPIVVPPKTIRAAHTATVGQPAMKFATLSGSLDHVRFPFTALTGIQIPVPLTAAGPVGDDGVEQSTIGGCLSYHPVKIAQSGLEFLDSYASVNQDEYLSKAKAYADRLIAEAVHARGAYYVPYRFDFALAGNKNDMMTAPWYSAMAQGEAVSLCVRLYELTHDQKYKDAADKFFTSFLRPYAKDQPWTVFVDDEGYLWFEEYAKDPPMRVLNGHLFALFGVYDYYELTKSPAAKSLIQGGAATVRHYFSQLRDPGQISFYSLRVHVQSAKYHDIHIRELQMLAKVTKDSEFNDLAAQLRSDHDPSQDS